MVGVARCSSRVDESIPEVAGEITDMPCFSSSLDLDVDSTSSLGTALTVSEPSASSSARVLCPL